MEGCRRRHWSLRLAASGPPVAERIELAQTFPARLRGLLGRTGLAAGEGLWLKGTNGVHTLGMRFAIDVLFLDREQRVLAICHGLGPGRIAGAVPGATSCLELASGTARCHGLQPGDQLFLTASPPSS